MATHDIVMSAAGGTSADVAYIDDVFSTYLYSGTGSAITINNGIDLAGKGGMVWVKNRTYGYDNSLFDTTRGANKWLISNATSAQANSINMLDSFNSNGFTIGTDAYSGGAVNASGSNYASWTFAKQEKFFDVVTWTGNGVDGRTIAHNLGSTPGCIIVKQTSGTSTWRVYHRSTGNDKVLILNDTAAASTGNSWAYTDPTSTVFSVSDSLAVNASGETYVAYLFAHDAGGFGTAGTDNVISCGSFTATGSPQEINVGFEPQWILFKNTNISLDWFIFDVMRGMSYSASSWLRPNSSAAESNSSVATIKPTATGWIDSFWDASFAGSNVIYIAIRRPMKPPTTGTEVFSVDTQGQYSPKPPGHTSGFVTDMALVRDVTTTNSMLNVSRLTGTNYLITSSTAAQGSLSFIDFDYMNGWADIATTDANYYSWMFRRAATFFDVVCDTGTGSAHTINHNLTVAPELIIRKSRTSAGNMDWWVYASPLGATNYLILNATAATSAYTGVWNDTAPTSTEFTVGNYVGTNASGASYVSYLFATVAGVSKVGSYTGTGTTQQVNCGFSGGARFVLIKRTDSTGDWYVWDTARGIVSGNDPYLLMNSTAAEVTSTDYIDPYSAGFEISSTAPAAINANGGSYIYLAIA